MAQYYNVVTNPNGTFSIEELQQICSIDGQRVQFVVEDIHNGANLISQPIVAYAAAPETAEQTIFTQSTINVGAQIANAQLESRQNVYIIKTNDPPIQQTIYNKIEAENSRFQGDNSLKVNQGNWLNTRENNEQFELVIKTEPSPVKNFVPTTVRTQQQITTAQVAAPNVVLQSGPDKKATRLVPIAKRNSLGNPVGILRTSLQQAANLQPAKVGKMKRNSTAASNSSVSLPVRSRSLTGSVNTTQLTTPPRGPQARPPIHSDAFPKNPTPLSKNTPVQPEIGHLSERIKQTTLKQKQLQQLNEQRQKQQPPVVTVNPIQRPVQSAQGPLQRQRAMGQLLQRQTNSQQQQQLQRQLQQQQQQQQQQQVLQQSQQIQAAVADESVEQPMEVDSSENIVQLERLNCTSKSDPEENSSESFAYLREEIDNPHTTIVQHHITGNEAKMLVILADGQQRLITFEVPKEDCTVQDLLEQADVYSAANTEPHVSLVSDSKLNINYIVDVTPRTASNEEEHSIIMPAETTTVVTNIVETKSPDKSSNSSQPARLPTIAKPPIYIEGKLAVCPFCGMSASDFNYCLRCKRKLPANVKSIPICSDISTKKDTSVPPETFYKKSETGVQKSERDVVPKRGRGRGRGVARPKQVKEPECLTISSDEEDDNRKKRLEANKDLSTPLNSTNFDEPDTILDKEPIITNSTCIPRLSNQQPTSTVKEENPSDDLANIISTTLACRTVRIGSYKYAPANPILISSVGLKLEVPLLEDVNTFITVDIRPTDLVKALLHFSKSMPVLFFYTTAQTGLRIRDLLGMQDVIGPYFDPAGKDQTHRRITLLPDTISDESKTALKQIYKNNSEELNAKEANDILVQASPKTKSTQQFINVQNSLKKQTSTSSSNSTSSNGVIQTITVYPPPPAKGGIAINTEDFICLGEDQFLNDVIIDFYLKYLTLEVLLKSDHNRTHVFSSYFYKRLTSPHTQAVDNTENLSPAAKRHARVQKWTKNVNIFEKDFIVIPINEHAHWFLAIICYPGLVGTVAVKTEGKSTDEKVADKKKKDVKAKNVRTIGETTITPVNTTILIDTNDDGSERDEAEGDDEEMATDSDEDDESESKENADQVEKTICQTSTTKEVNKVPCILIFDSLAGASRCRVVATLRDYLSCEYQAKMGSEKVFSKDTIKGACPKVPQQSNFTDCGLYVLQYVESFFKTPITDYTLPIKTLKIWFEEIIVTRKREEIANLLIKLVGKTKGNKTINLPKLVFPTQDGQLKQKPEQAETKTSKVEVDKKKTTEATENKTAAVVTSSQSSEISSEASKSGISQSASPQSSNQASSTTDSSLLVQKEVVAATTTTPTTKSTAETMSYLKNKRIQRIQKSSDNPEDKQAAKKHKGESFDSCK